MFFFLNIDEFWNRWQQKKQVAFRRFDVDNSGTITVFGTSS